MSAIQCTDETTMLRSADADADNRLREMKGLVAGDSSIVLRTDDRYLLRFLHCADFDPHEAYTMMKTWNELRLQHAEWFCNAPPEDFGRFMGWQAKAILDGRDRQGRRIYLTKMGRLRPAEASMTDLARYDELWIESVLDEPDTQANGICCIVDMDGYSWRLFKWLSPKNVRISTRCVQNVPIKSLVVHVVNSSMLMNASVALVYPFLSSDFKKNVHFHQQNWPSLHEHVAPEFLPEEYGGTGRVPDFTAHNAWLLEQSPRLTENFKRDNRM